jgi:hypothetical protein
MRRIHGSAALGRALLGVIAFGTFTLVLGSPATAAVFRAGRSVVIPAGETVHDDLYVAGQHVEILGTVTGDVVAAGRELVIGGYVGGSAMAAGRVLRLQGHVAGSVRGAGERIECEGMVGRDALVACNTFRLSPGARVVQDAAVAASSARFDGPVGRNLWLGGAEFDLADSVGGSVRADARALRLEGGAVVAGDLQVESRGTLVRDPSSQVLGTVEVRPAEGATGAKPGGGAFGAVTGWLQGLFGFLVLGLIVMIAFRAFWSRGLESLGRSPLQSLGVGVLVAAATPVAMLLMFLVGLVLGGWWIGLIGCVLYLLALLLGYTCSAAHVGGLLLARLGRGAAPWLALLAGLVVVGLVVKVPFLGWIAGIAAMLFGTGALGLALRGPRLVPSREEIA